MIIVRLSEMVSIFAGNVLTYESGILEKGVLSLSSCDPASWAGRRRFRWDPFRERMRLADWRLYSVDRRGRSLSALVCGVRHFWVSFYQAWLQHEDVMSRGAFGHCVKWPCRQLRRGFPDLVSFSSCTVLAFPRIRITSG